ncbi:hypothetical protein GUJ93_ZPchr0011g27577 [Zizania palustris]|uniref:Retrotransposon gag domain-containing protein n=1 Tax=Zizania palustris TaxID=103762 RepID=A0A8J5WLM2_ZIZPA|nr:hypothetical protein GUJ93_ZPchr0011g27577 [Zizania palustris]
MIGLRKEINDDHGHLQLPGQICHNMESAQHEGCDILKYYLAKVESSLPLFDGKFDSEAYVNWELAVDKEFDKYDFSNAQMIRAASKTFIDSASFWWTYTDNRPETWHDCKIMMRRRFVFSYYKRALRDKLENLKQANRTVREYYHEFKICILYSGLEECHEKTMTRFLKGLNLEIQILLTNTTYSHLGHLFLLSCNVESQILREWLCNGRKQEQCELFDDKASESPILLRKDDMKSKKKQSLVPPFTKVL